MSSMSEVITLHSISGKSATLRFPTTFKAVLDAAVAAPFSFTPESVKIFERGQLVSVVAHLRQHPAVQDGGFLDASAYTTAPMAARGQRGAVEAPLSMDKVQTTPALLRPSPARSLLVFGVPRRVRALCGGREAERTQAAPAASSSVSPLSAPSRTPAVQPASSVGESSSAARMTTLNASGKAARLPADAHTEGAVSLTHPRHSSPPPPKRVDMRGPLPYPHSPDGLLELAKAVSDPNADLDDGDDLISLLQGAPQCVYNHPTMSYISNRVKGNLVTLRAVVEQIYRVAPVFYAWMEHNPQKFLSALNRVGERSMQQVREQLRLLALQAVAGQLNGTGPSRRVMTLEVNTRDGSPDVYQVEVQVGDFSDDEDEDEDSLRVGSVFYASLEQSDDMDYEEEEEGYNQDEEDEEAEEEETEELTATGSTSGQGDVPDHGTPDELRHAAVLAEGAEDREANPGSRQMTGEAGEDDDEDGRGAARRSPVRAAALAEECVTRRPGPSLTAPTPPPGSAPTRAWRPSSSPATADALNTPSASAHRAAAASPPTTTTTAHTTATASSGPTSATTEETPVNVLDDARLERLRTESHVVNALREQYTRQADMASAQQTHCAIMALRPKFFATVGELCTSTSEASSSSAKAAGAAQHGQVLQRVVRCATDFFIAAEEFYIQLEEEGVRASTFGPSQHESLAAWAAVAALSRLLLADVDAAVQDAVAAAESTTATTPASASGPRRVGALRALHADNVLWSHPALHWALTRGPEELLASVLHLCRQQRAVVLWYSSHYLMKPVGKTVQTLAYVFGGTEEAQQAVALQRLKMTSKAHKSDEVASCLGEMARAGGASDGTRRQWVALMRARYQQLVRPLEADLPTPHMTSNSLYVCDTRHVLPSNEAQEERARRSMDSAARWWAGYCDDRNTLCADKWCLAATMRPWDVVVASENARDTRAAERAAICVAGMTHEASLSEEATRCFHGFLPVQEVEVVGCPSPSASTSAATASAARHSCILCEYVSASPELSATETTSRGTSSATHGLAPHYIGDLHVVDVASCAEAGQQFAITRMAGGADVFTHLATVVRNFALPVASSRVSFLRHFFDMLAAHPKIPVAAAARHAALTNATANDAPWLVCEYVLLDYGGVISSLGSTGPAAVEGDMRANMAQNSDAFGEASAKGFVRMPSVPLGRRLSEPRPVSTVSRHRSGSLSDSEGRSTTRVTSTAAEEDALKRQYARTHAIDELYEMMLGSLLEHQPMGEANVLDHLVNFLETSEEAMQERVQRRQTEVVAAESAAPMEVVKGASSAKAFASPQPPTTKRHAKSRSSLTRKKSSS